jgi:hypothetical protein
MDSQIKRKWINALQSGEYKQGVAYLRNGMKFCCLGVLCDLHAKEMSGSWEQPYKKWEWVDGIYGAYLGVTRLPPPEVLEWADLNVTKELTVRNDVIRQNFFEIAKYIEENL